MAVAIQEVRTHSCENVSGAAESPPCGRRSYVAPHAQWLCLTSALRANQPSGESDDLGDRIRTRPPRSKGAERS